VKKSIRHEWGGESTFAKKSIRQFAKAKILIHLTVSLQ
jgi:hypothetical protein